MKRQDFHIGPGAASMLLVAVVVSMGVLGLLALISTHNDQVLTVRSQALATREYAASARAEAMLAELDGVLLACGREASDQEDYLERVALALPEGMAMEGSQVYWQVTSDGGRTLRCGVTLAPLGETPRCAWREHLFSAEADEALWD